MERQASTRLLSAAAVLSRKSKLSGAHSRLANRTGGRAWETPRSFRFSVLACISKTGGWPSKVPYCPVNFTQPMDTQRLVPKLHACKGDRYR